jgi:hypothetical protein
LQEGIYPSCSSGPLLAPGVSFPDPSCPPREAYIGFSGGVPPSRSTALALPDFWFACPTRYIRWPGRRGTSTLKNPEIFPNPPCRFSLPRIFTVSLLACSALNPITIPDHSREKFRGKRKNSWVSAMRGGLPTGELHPARECLERNRAHRGATAIFRPLWSQTEGS